MKFYKRAWLSVKRQISKSVILFLVTFVLAMGIILSFLIRTGINETKTNMEKSLNLTTTVQMFTEPKVDKEKIELYEKLAKSPYIDYYDYSQLTNGFYVKDTNVVKVDNFPKDANIDQVRMISSVQNPNFLTLKNEYAKLVDGRSFTPEEIKDGANVIIVTSQFAKENNLKVGQKVQTEVAERNLSLYTGASEEPVIKKLAFEELEIVGIMDFDINKLKINADQYGEITAEQKKEDVASSKASKLNEIVTTPGVVERVVKKQIENIDQATMEENGGMLGVTYGYPVFVAKDPDALVSFVEEAKNDIKKFKEKNGADKVYMSEVISDLNQVESAKDNIKSVSNLANIIFVVLIALSVVVLALVVTLFLRDRRHEFGIYMALGEKKGKTIAQVLIETLIIGVLAFTLAFATSGIFANNISKSIITNSSSSTTTEESNMFDLSKASISDVVPSAGEGIDSNYIVNNYQIKIGVTQIVLVYAIGVITLTLATVIPMIYVQRLNPRKILM